MQLQYENAAKGKWRATVYRQEKREVDHFEPASVTTPGLSSFKNINGIKGAGDKINKTDKGQWYSTTVWNVINKFLV